MTHMMDLLNLKLSDSYVLGNISYVGFYRDIFMDDSFDMTHG